MNLLEIKMEDETVNDCMVKWAQNIGYSVKLEGTNLENGHKAVKFKENFKKIFLKY